MYGNEKLELRIDKMEETRWIRFAKIEGLRVLGS